MKTYTASTGTGKRVLLYAFLLLMSMSTYAQIDLELNLSVDDPNYTRLQNKSFTLSLNNSGSATATNINIKLNFPNTLTYTAINPSTGNFEPISSEWTINSLGVNQSATLDLVLTPTDDSSPIVVFAQVESVDQNDTDSTPGNNLGTTPSEDDETAVTLIPISTDNFADMELSLESQSSNSIEIGEEVTIAFFAINKGPRDANNVVINVDIPNEFEISSSVPTIGSYANGKWTIPDFDNGNTGRLTLTAEAMAPINSAIFFAQFESVDVDDPDSTPGNNPGTLPDEDDEAFASVTVTGTLNCTLNGAEVITNCNDNGTDRIDDDLFSVSILPVGTNLGDSYSVSGDVSLSNLSYGSPQSLGEFLISNGSITITITDDTRNCEFTTTINPTNPCSPGEVFCNLTDAGLNVVCNDNGTSTPDDDLFSVSINPQGTDLSNGYTISGDINVTNLDYGSAQNLGSFNISDGILNIIITDNSENCELDIVVTPPAPCSTPDPVCNLTDARISVVCNDNGTATPDDDLFGISINPQGTNLGDSYSISGDISMNDNEYGSPLEFGFFAISDGILNITITDSSGDCELDATITPPAPCSTPDLVCNLTDARISVVCNDNGTATPDDDLFGISINPQGTNLGDSYSISGDISMSDIEYGSPLEFGFFAISDGVLNITITDSSGDCELDATITPPVPCSTPDPICDLRDAGLRLVCDDNETATPDDDLFSVSLNPQGTNLGDGYSISGDINLSDLNYGSAINIGTFKISDGTLNIIITDSSEDCELEVVITPPAPCSEPDPVCDLTNTGLRITCDDNNTESTEDDLFSVSVNPQGSNLSSTYSISGDVEISNLNYGSAQTIGTFKISGGALNITITDDSEDCAIEGIRIAPPAPCSEVDPPTKKEIDLELMLNVDRPNYIQYEYVNYTLTVANEGDRTANRVQVYFPMPEGFVYDSHSTTKGDFNWSEGAWRILKLEPGERATLNWRQFALVKNVPIRAFAEVIDVTEDDVDSTPNNGDGITPNEDDEAVVQLGPIGDTDLELDLSTDKDKYQIYDNVAFKCKVTNTGNNQASNISVVLPLPEGMVYTSSSVSQGMFDLFYATWVVGSLQPGESATLELVLFALVDNQNLSTYAEVATASPRDVDSTPGNFASNPDEDDSASVDVGGVSKRSLPLLPGYAEQTGSGNSTSQLQQVKLYRVFPNPTPNQFEIVLTSKVDTETQIQIYNDLGQIVQQQKAGIIKGVNRLKLNLAQEASGIYHVMLFPANGKPLTTRVLKQGL